MYFKRTFFLLTVLVAVGHIVLLAYETKFSPEMVERLVFVTSFFVSASFLLLVLLAVRDLVLASRAALRRFKKLPKAENGPLERLSLIGVVLASVGLSVAGTLCALSVPSVEEVEIRIDGLPAELSGLRIVHVSDLHSSPLFPRIRTQVVVYRVNALRPDVVALTGDFSDGDMERRASDLEPLANISARYGVYAVLGNHDYFANPVRTEEILDKAGVRVLNNASMSFDVKGKTVTIAGVTDPTASKRGIGRPNLGQALASTPEDQLRILLAHRPATAFVASDPKFGVDLQLSGHTHAGQTWGLASLVSSLNRGLNEGFYRLRDMALYVSPGTALWPGFPLRLGTKNTITVIRLVSTADD